MRRYTWTDRLVAVVSDGTAVLGLGDIGPRASLPVMEGKSALFKQFGGLDSIPLVLDTTDVDEIVENPRPAAAELRRREPGGRLRAALLRARTPPRRGAGLPRDARRPARDGRRPARRPARACAATGRDLPALRVVVSGAGAAGIACARFLVAAGVRDVVVLDSRGVVDADRGGRRRCWRRRRTPAGSAGAWPRPWPVPTCSSACPARSCRRGSWRRWRPGRSCSPCPTPTPRSTPRRRGAVRLGRRDGPQRLPPPDQQRAGVPGGVRRGAGRGCPPDHRGDKLAAAEAIAAVAADGGAVSVDRIVPSPFDPRVGPAVAAAVAQAARRDPQVSAGR